ncbi:nitrilase [Roseibium sp. RKSG952]|nr:nitrilase [Roseibium sp. RKSG952]
MERYDIALWSLNLGFAPRSAEEFAAHIAGRLEQAAAAGARLMMMPEYAIEAALAFKPEGLKPTEEIAYLAETGEKLVDLVKGLPVRHGVSLLLGTMPVRSGQGHTNTAILLTADGRVIRQDKLCLTPFEKDPQSWKLEPGTELHVFELDGLKMAILVCLDVEMPALSCLLAAGEIDLLLVPSMTEMTSGYHRVYGCAKARAVELMTAVAVCGTIGVAKGTTQNTANVSGAALFMPCEEELGFDGVALNLPPISGEKGAEYFSVVPVEVEVMRRLRRGGAEVWPGGWSASHVCLTKLN